MPVDSLCVTMESPSSLDASLSIGAVKLDTFLEWRLADGLPGGLGLAAVGVLSGSAFFVANRGAGLSSG